MLSICRGIFFPSVSKRTSFPKGSVIKPLLWRDVSERQRGKRYSEKPDRTKVREPPKKL